VTAALPLGIVALPFATAALLMAVGSWRIGTWLNLGSAVLLFLLACVLPWQTQAAPPVFVADAAATQLVLLTSLVAMTASGFGMRYVRHALEQQVLNRRRVRLHHVACQWLVGAIMLALLSDLPALTWLALALATCGAAAITGVVRNPEAAAAATHLHLLCGAGLMLAMVGTLLLHLAVEPHASHLHWSTLHAATLHRSAFELACIFLVIGYAALAGLVPLHLWLPDAMEHGAAPGAIIVGTLMVNAPLLVFLRLGAASSAVLIAVGLASLLLGAVSLFVESDPRRRVALAGIAQLGVVAFAIGVAAAPAAMLYLTLLVLVRVSVLQCIGAPQTRLSTAASSAGMVALAILPLFALLLVASATVDRSPWLLLPLGAGITLTSWALLRR
jgi:hydrogenase-4 component F